MLYNISHRILASHWERWACLSLDRIHCLSLLCILYLSFEFYIALSLINKALLNWLRHSGFMKGPKVTCSSAFSLNCLAEDYFIFVPINIATVNYFVNIVGHICFSKMRAYSWIYCKLIWKCCFFNRSPDVKLTSLYLINLEWILYITAWAILGGMILVSNLIDGILARILELWSQRRMKFKFSCSCWARSTCIWSYAIIRFVFLTILNWHITHYSVLVNSLEIIIILSTISNIA